jgi:hypothetical protein
MMNDQDGTLVSTSQILIDSADEPGHVRCAVLVTGAKVPA